MFKRSFGKKGATGDMYIFMFIHVPILILVMFGLVVVTNKYILTTTDISETEAEILLYSMIINPEIFTHVDFESGRGNMLLIDTNEYHLLEKKLESAYAQGKSGKLFSAKITLYDSSGKLYNSFHDFDSSSEFSLYVNKVYFNSWYELSKGGLLGPGSYAAVKKKFLVNLIEGDELKNGFLEIIVVVPRS